MVMMIARPGGRYGTLLPGVPCGQRLKHFEETAMDEGIGFGSVIQRHIARHNLKTEAAVQPAQNRRAGRMKIDDPGPAMQEGQRQEKATFERLRAAAKLFRNDQPAHLPAAFQDFRTISYSLLQQLFCQRQPQPHWDGADGAYKLPPEFESNCYTEFVSFFSCVRKSGSMALCKARSMWQRRCSTAARSEALRTWRNTSSSAGSEWPPAGKP